MLEIVIITASSVLGALSVSILHSSKTVKKSMRRFKGRNSLHSVESARHEVESLKLERDALADKINRAYEANNKGKIDRYERDRLILNSREQIRQQNLRIKELEEIANYSEILRLRSELVGLLETRISEIDNKLRELSTKILANDASNLESFVDVDNRRENEMENSMERTQISTTIKTKRLAIYGHAEEKIQKMQQDISQALMELEKTTDLPVNDATGNRQLSDKKMTFNEVHNRDALSYCIPNMSNYD